MKLIPVLLYLIYVIHLWGNISKDLNAQGGTLLGWLEIHKTAHRCLLRPVQEIFRVWKFGRVLQSKQKGIEVLGLKQRGTLRGVIG